MSRPRTFDIINLSSRLNNTNNRHFSHHLSDMDNVQQIDEDYNNELAEDSKVPTPEE